MEVGGATSEPDMVHTASESSFSHGDVMTLPRRSCPHNVPSGRMVEKRSSLRRGVLREDGRSHMMFADLRGVLNMSPSSLRGENTPLSPSGWGRGLTGVKDEGREKEVCDEVAVVCFGEMMLNRGERDIGSRSTSAKKSFTGERKEVSRRSKL